MTEKWTKDNMPDLHGRRFVVTGANSGIGYEASRALARRGAHVILACRNMDKGQWAHEQIRQAAPEATLELMHLDLADLTSIRSFAEEVADHHSWLDFLINNAGVMAIPYRQTADGFEMQFGTNHLGHFALTGLLLPILLRAPQARVVTVSSGLHRQGKINFADLQSTQSYNKRDAYSMSKLANVLFAFELQRRFETAGVRAISTVVHPGYADTNLQAAGPKMENSRVGLAIMSAANRLFAQSAAMGALPTLYAATAAEVQGCDFIGPDGLWEMRGHPTKVDAAPRAQDREVAARLWRISEELTGVRYTALDGVEQSMSSPQPV